MEFGRSSSIVAVPLAGRDAIAPRNAAVLSGVSVTVAITRAPASSVIGNGATSSAGRMITPPSRTVRAPVKSAKETSPVRSRTAFSTAIVPAPEMSQFIAKYGFAAASPANASVVPDATTTSPR